MLTLSVRSLAAALAAVFAAAGTAHAAGCVASYDAATRVVTIGNCNPGPDAPTTAAISRTADGQIRFDGQTIPGGPTVTNTAAIDYVGEDGNRDEITVDMSNGRFAPGFGPEIGVPEIEITIDGGTGATNFLTVLGDADETDAIDAAGDDVINVTGDGDADITRSNVTGRLVIDGQGGNDFLKGNNGFDAFFDAHGTGSVALDLRGGPGRDSLAGGDGNDTYRGGAEYDYIVERADVDFTLTDTTLTGLGDDTVEGIESATLQGGNGPNVINAAGFSGAGILYGFGSADTLTGGVGHDAFRGDAGNDIIDGGPGNDYLSDSVGGAAVLTSTGLTSTFGDDTLASIEQAFLFGTPDDDTVDASAFPGSVEVNAGAGADRVIGGPGNDAFDGGEGDDELTGGPGIDGFLGGPGNDRAFSADGITELVDCGDGNDTAVSDAVDGLQACEQVDRGERPAQPEAGGGEPGGDGGTPPVGPAEQPAPADRTAPVISGLSLARKRFPVRRGTAFAFTLSEPATVTIAIDRLRKGRRAARRRGTLTKPGLALGLRKVAFSGRLGGRALRRGRYRATLTAVDAAGNVSRPLRIRFRVVR